MKNRNLTGLATGLFMFVMVTMAFANEFYKGHQYFLTPLTETWTEAESWAVAAGGHLVTINDAAEKDWIVSTFSVSSGPFVVWFGLYQPDPNSIEPDQGWVWVSGAPDTYRDWMGYQPDNWGGIEDYGVMVIGATDPTAGTWVDHPNQGWPFSSRFSGLVEKTPEIAPSIFLLGIGIASLAVTKYGMRKKR